MAGAERGRVVVWVCEGGMDTASVHLFGRVGVNPAVEQQAHHLEVALLGGHEEACGAVLPAKAVTAPLTKS
jgi:hypothetical protein